MNYTLHNVAETFKENDGGIKINRFTQKVRDNLDTELGKINAEYIYCGCELRFVINSGTARVVLECNSDGFDLPKVYINLGNFQSAWVWDESRTLKTGVNEIEISYPENFDALERISKEQGFEFSPRAVRLKLPNAIRVLDVIGDIRKPDADELPQKSILFYGSSITHGSNSLNPTAAYVSVCGRILGADVLNKGMPGSCYLEKETVNFVFNHEVSMFVIELGTNCFSNESPEWFKERVLNIINTHKAICPQKPLLLIDLFRSWPHPLCTQIVEELLAAEKPENVAFVRGDDILDDIKYYSSDLVHPTMDGHYVIADRVCNAIKENFNLF